MLYVRTLHTEELNLLFRLYQYNNPEEMLTENTRDINGKSKLMQKGYSEFTIGVEEDNKAAQHIYTKLGFTKLLGKIREEYQGDCYEYGLYLKS